jgi:LysR family glycine cleavage system transcriptional activator
MTEDFFPVCAPALLAKGPRLEKPGDLRHYTLLHDEMREDWRKWFLAAGVGGIDPTRGPSFSHSDMVIQAAIAGEGVALGRSPFVAADLAAGRLVKPFDIALKSDWAFYFVAAPSMLARPKVAAFRAWLIEVAAGAEARG